MKRKTIPFLLLVILAFAACKSKVSTYHLPPAKMGKLMMDIHTAEIYSSIVTKDSLHRRDEKNMDSVAFYYKEIFAHYRITKEQFDESMDWYRHHPEDLDSLYTKMLPELSKLEGVFKAKK